MSNPFDRSKNYRNLNFQEGQMGFDKDFNHDANLTRDQVEQSMIGLLGWSLVRQSALVPPVPISGLRCDVQVNDQINFSENGNGNGRYSFEMVDATHIKWKYNNNAWNDNGGIGYPVTCDGVTWNYDVGTSGFDFTFHADTNTGDAQIIIASKGMRLAGGEIITPPIAVADRVCLYHGYWLLQDRWVDLDATNLDGVVDGDLMYVKITETEVDYTADVDLEHRLPDGRLYPTCPTATQVEYEVLSCQPAALPDDTSTEKHIVICGLENDATVVIPTPVWSEPWDLQKLIRNYTESTATLPTCLISITDNPPTVTLSRYSKDDGLRGVEVAITNIPANTQKMTIWTGPDGLPWNKDGSSFYDTIDFESDVGFSTTKTIIIPEDPSGGLGVEVQCIDEYGIYHGDSIGAVGFVGSDSLVAWTVPWIDNVFSVGEGGCQFSTIQSAIDAVHDSGISDAEIHIHGGEYTEDLSFNAAFNANLTIKGFGGAEVIGDFDLDNIKTMVPDGRVPSKNYTLQVKDIKITGQVNRTTFGNDGMVSFQDCSIQNIVDAPAIDVRSGSGSNPLEFILRLEDCFVYRETGTSELVFIGTSGGNKCTLGFHFINTIFVCDSCDGVNGLIQLDYSATLDTIPWLMTRCTIQTSAINSIKLNNTGTYKTINCTYLMYYATAISSTLDIEFGSVDTNTLMPVEPLTMHE